MIEFRMPSLGADMEAGFLREWKVKPGDLVKRGDIIAEIETQKGIIDIEVFDEGIVGELMIAVDEKVPVGTLMTHILSAEEATADILPAQRKVETKKMAPATAIKQREEEISIQATAHHLRASPLAKKVAAEKGIDLSKITGSGPDGAIIREDVEKAVTDLIAPGPPTEKTAADNIRMAVAAAMSKSNREVPHYYLQSRVDMS
ncbi:MAG: E3 binding domain-containing protein, partial [Cyclobacteriaceae bacterium]|nr:E3 binding domain-containing protein [Cyclobacteriaceae bacterium]